MADANRFILDTLEIDELPDTFVLSQVLDLVRVALQHSTDQRSELDDERIENLRGALAKIEQSTTDRLASRLAKQALLLDSE
ncbi:hypothetical protein [Pseudomonas guariconensis]|uniref:hypothetical protein n=1 Tax=Pseudomonas guariconensis TaxID=1288410 RepID=UPI0039067B2C